MAPIEAWGGTVSKQLLINSTDLPPSDISEENVSEENIYDNLRQHLTDISVLFILYFKNIGYSFSQFLEKCI